MIPFNKPVLTGKELLYIGEAVASGKISGDGIFTKRCHQIFEDLLQSKKCLLTTSCTDALELCALLLNIKEGDEVIMPSYTFVSTANAFVLRGAKIVFADSGSQNPNMDVDTIEPLVNEKTKAIVAVHYAGVACDMDKLLALTQKHKLYLIEDAAQAIDSYCINSAGEKKALGSIGHLATFSFHETKNIQCGEGGLLAINDEQFISRAEIMREKGTNRSSFFRGEVNKYGWVDIGSSFLPSEVVAAFLFAQLENLEKIQNKRKELWNVYYDRLSILEKENKIKLPFIPEWATNNAHMFYVICNSIEERTQLIDYLRSKNILSVFHYLSLHESPYYQPKYEGKKLPWSNYYTDRLLRLPLYFELTVEEVNMISNYILEFFK
ncbi:dTDP-4-amino-4,6-dideoxygalactose transaminase [Pinibacter aurantiacus]|uniref:dTDP-4-amino-4,6-dideoxygalactose transaminase n=1 Tax=Pinibacter aurantiacus TaxID=2851599 RepID=A0A9E2S9Y7_9BACT|nr:dTDP-4-amino-4,6-dideoxygalactose transaminase [Pinibacter aurantiacus]MBV4356065.1 dTDP-4-amino-4,6-dideoxygalactose transaminase [Pinibacter aurantiacus]